MTSNFWATSRRHPSLYILPVLIVYLLAGMLLVTHYGETTDEVNRIAYAESSLQAYHTGKSTGLLDEKGPIYGMLSLQAGKVLRRIFPDWQFIDGWHYMTLISFVIGVFFFYRLCLRLVKPVPALGAALLFSTQPLIWGHAFINPKDMPFMAFFIASVSLGLEMADRIIPRDPIAAPALSWRWLRSGLTGRPAGFIDGILSGWRAFLLWLRSSPGGLWAWLGLAWGQVSREWKAASARRRLLFSANGLLLVALIASYWVISPFRRTPQASLRQNPLPDLWLTLLLAVGLAIILRLAGRKVFPGAAEQLKAFLPHTWIVLAGCFLGFASDIRTLGPASGLLVGAYLLLKGGRRAVPALLEYIGVGAVITYIFWPYLWAAPFTSYAASLSQAADFPWLDTVLFRGTIYKYNALPSSYIPIIFSVQLTEAAIALILVGLVVASIYFWGCKGLRLDLLLLGTWLVAPIAAAILLHSTVYDNARQFLFALPPLFVLAALALQALWDLPGGLRSRWAFALLVMALVGQGLYWDARLHPYEYIYYNGLVGGVRGAFRHYELDYWAASYRADFSYLNQTAPPHAKIYVYGPDLVASTYIRPDLVIIGDNPDQFKVDYAVILNKRNLDISLYEESKVIFQVERENSILSVIKKVKRGDTLYK